MENVISLFKEAADYFFFDFELPDTHKFYY